MMTPVFQVSEFIEAVNQHLSLLQEIVIEGEISRIDVKNNRLIFLTIKDNQSSADVFALTHIVRNYSQLEAGMLVHVYGTAGLYKGSGKFRIQASHIAPHGEGALQMAYDKLKSQLDAAGLFDPSHKRPLPAWPQNIGLITAAGSSAYHDLVKILTSRMGGLSIKHLPVNVQGRDAVPTILKALQYINHHPKQFDVIILARGGGSLEDLQAFNSEDVAKAVFACKVPVVSAVGHEDDWSLTDFTADARASTPSNAAEIVVQDNHQTTIQLQHNINYMKQQLTHTIGSRQKLVHTNLLIVKRVLDRFIQSAKQTFVSLNYHQQNIIQNIKSQKQQITTMTTACHLKLNHTLIKQNTRLDHLSRLLASLNHQKVLKRGYSITTDQSGSILKDIHTINQNQSIITTLAKGKVTSIITKKES